MTAAERATRVLVRAVLDAREHEALDAEDHAVWCLNALMADPDLLVDLAIEAGGLEQLPYVGFSDGERVALTDDIEETFALSAQWKTWRDGPFAVYRRTTQEDQ